jgi:hypothetical protein
VARLTPRLRQQRLADLLVMPAVFGLRHQSAQNPPPPRTVTP